MFLRKSDYVSTFRRQKFCNVNAALGSFPSSFYKLKVNAVIIGIQLLFFRENRIREIGILPSFLSPDPISLFGMAVMPFPLWFGDSLKGQSLG